MIHAKSLKKRELKQYLIGRLNETCRWCNVNHHLPVCPRVKKYSFHPDGSLAGVEFYTVEELSYSIGTTYKAPLWTPTTSQPTTS